MPGATRAELAKTVALSVLSPLFLGGRPRPRLAAGECGAKGAPQCSTWAGLEVPASSGACKQRQADKTVPTNTNYYQKDQNQTKVWTKTKQKDPNDNGCVLQCETKYQPTCSVPLKYDEHPKSHGTFTIIQ